MSVAYLGFDTCPIMLTNFLFEQGIVSKEIPLNPGFNRTGDIWHIFLPDMEPNLLYGYRVDGRYNLEEGACYDRRRILVDPYAKVSHRPLLSPNFFLSFFLYLCSYTSL